MEIFSYLILLLLPQLQIKSSNNCLFDNQEYPKGTKFSSDSLCQKGYQLVSSNEITCDRGIFYDFTAFKGYQTLCVCFFVNK